MGTEPVAGQTLPPPNKPARVPPGQGQFDKALATAQAQADTDAKSLYDATDGGLTGWGTDEDTIWRTLEGKSETQINLIRQSYQEHYGKNLDDKLRDETSGKDREHVDALLKGSGNQAEVDSVKIQAELEGVFGDEQEVLKIIEHTAPENRQQLADAYVKKYGGSEAGGKSAKEFFLSKLNGSLNGEEMDRARSMMGASDATSPGEALRLQGQADAGRLKVAVDGMGTDEGTIKEVLTGKSPEQIAAIKQAYQEKYGHSLADRLNDEADGSAEHDVFNRLLNPAATGDTKANAAASAERLKLAVDGMGTDEDAIRTELQGKSKADIDAIKAAYKEKYGHELNDRLTEEAGDVGERDTWQRMLAPPAEGDTKAQAEASAERLRMAVDGMGTDEGAIRTELQGKSKSEIDTIAAAYKDKYGEDLRGRLDDELDGREQLELLKQDFDRGAIDPNDPNAGQERLRRLQEQQDGEKGVGLWLTSNIQKLTKGESDQDRLEGNMNAARSALNGGDGARADRLTGFAEGDLDSEQTAKDEASEYAAEGAAIVASTAVVIGTAGTAAPAVVAAWAAGAGALAAGGTYTVMQGGAADPADVAKQTALGAATGATAIVGGGAGVTAVGKQAVAGTAKEIIATGGKQAGGRTLITAAKDGTINGAKAGAAGGAAYNATDTATQRETWEDGLLPGLARVGTSAAQGVATGTVLGAGTGAMVSAGLHGVRPGRAPGPASESAPASHPVPAQPKAITAGPGRLDVHRNYLDADLAELTKIRGEIADAAANGGLRPDGTELGRQWRVKLGESVEIGSGYQGNYRTTLGFADVDIPGVDLGRIKSFSSKAELAGFAPKIDPQRAFFKPLDIGVGNRLNDAEAKIFQQIFDATAGNPNVTGNVRLVIDRQSCDSCANAAAKLLQLRPNLKIDVVVGPIPLPPAR